MITIGKPIYHTLANMSGLVEDRIFPIIAPEKTNLPFIVYERDSVVPQYTKDGLSGNEVIVSFYILANDYTKSTDLAQLVRDAFEKKKLSYQGVNIKDCDLIDADEAYNDYAFIQKITLKFKTN